ncbi:MAG: TlyA family rRNA (cytidine-2'-O)-methyltransferase, partial [Verrucomicrobia bacterium]|nr:TlyA family rRNA (cytidine-2'-O)-methyltransferase [Verrucomicrobiota bacterium]
MKRLDQAMVELGLCTSREQARRSILAGDVRINGHPAHKPSDAVRPEDALSLVAKPRYVSRGGDKLEGAIAHFGLNQAFDGVEAVDLGASTGGFTDCLLQHGASKVYAVDVGRGQLAWKLRQDPRVVVMEGCNARHISRSSFQPGFRPVPWIVAD